MSGFAGVVHLDGAPVDPILIDRMTRALVFRGPDEQHSWCEGPAGMGHALLRTTRESAHERQPAVLDGRLTIVADARIDARAELVEKLGRKSTRAREISLSTPDPELILHAFDVWGDACVDHLLGDFSFAIWDAPKRRLFCARDHFGVKQLYYARIGNAVVFGNMLDTLRLHPGFSPVLCDDAIADYLIFGMNWHSTRTPFDQILRVARAHTLVVSGDGLDSKRYWSFPIEEPLRYRSSQDYVTQFRELLCVAVKDRLRCDRVTISLSGGLDSPTVAAQAVEQLGSPENVLGITAGFKRIVNDPEPPFARAVAEHLKIPWQFIAIDDYKPFQRWESSELCLSIPANVTLAAMNWDFLDRATAHSRVLLTGEGGDPGLVPSLSAYRGFGAVRLAYDVGKYLVSHGHHPRIGFRVNWQRWRGATNTKSPSSPSWLDKGVRDRLDVRKRWSEVMKDPPSVHPYRPDAHKGLDGPRIAFYTTDDWSRRNVHVEARHPLFDLRIQRFFLRLPVLPWCADKEILRLSMRGHLPESILERPKSPVRGNPQAVMLRAIPRTASRDFVAAPELLRYVCQDRIPNIDSDQESSDPEIDLRPLNLNFWLQQNLHERC